MSAPIVSGSPTPMPPPTGEPLPAPAAKRAATSAGRWAYRIALAVVTVAAIFVTVVPMMMQRDGTRLVTLTSGSMSPLYPVGTTLVIDQAVDKASLQSGQVITFVNPAKDLVTHRIVKPVTNDNLPGVFYQTQGDANNAPDPDLTSAKAVVGVVVGPLTWWQELAVQGQSPKGRLLVFGSPFLLVIIGEGSDLVRALRRRRGASA